MNTIDPILKPLSHAPAHPMPKSKPCFKDILQQARGTTAQICWKKASLASTLQECSEDLGKPMQASVLRDLKLRSIQRLLELLNDATEAANIRLRTETLAR